MRSDEIGARPARVIAVGRNSAWIAFEGSHDLYLGVLPKQQERMSLVPGDLVLAARLDDERALVERREPRTFALERHTGGGRSKIMAANVDAIAIVTAFERPPFHAAMVDELLAFAEIQEIRALLLLTKADLADEASVQRIPALYRSLGYETLIINPKALVGMDAVDLALSTRNTLLIGQSGVGKSSLFRALGGAAVVGDVSKTGRGKQTTSSGRLHHFPEGFLIDSPGVGDFELRDVSPHELAQAFVEFRPLVSKCRFRDCKHLAEPNCAVREALAAGTIVPSRYDSYRAIAERPA